MLERTGHLANLEQPEKFNRAVFDFLSRHRG
jgi:pimeloyl-ACP methyl ester carboxylesterase